MKKDQRSRNRYLGGKVPFGWTRGEGGELIEDRPQQLAINRMRRMRDRGESFRAIATTLQADGFAISHMGIKKLLDAPAR